MKKPISRKTQMILVFIPLVNIFVLVAWISNCEKVSKKFRRLMQSILICFSILFTLVFFGFLFQMTLGSEHFFISLYYKLLLYIAPLAMGLGLISYQKHLGIE